MRAEADYTDEPTRIEGYRYTLVDERFEDLGFFNAHPVIFDALVLNKEEVENAIGDIPYSSASADQMGMD